jgi:hypothetical protein
VTGPADKAEVEVGLTVTVSPAEHAESAPALLLSVTFT